MFLYVLGKAASSPNFCKLIFVCFFPGKVNICVNMCVFPREGHLRDDHLVAYVFQINTFQGRSPHRAEEDGEQAARLQSWPHLDRGANKLSSTSL